MKKLKPKILNPKFIAISAVLLIAFGVLVSFIPYSGDDWAWGSQVGIDRLKNFFTDVNGSYLGYLIAIILTRVKALKIVSAALSLVFLCVVPYFFTKSNNVFTVILSALLILLAPKQFFAEAVAYTTGFSKLILPLILNLIYIYIIRNIFTDKEPYYKKYVAYIALFASFFGGICCEYFALFNVLFGLLLLIICRIKFYDAKNVNLFYFLGGLLSLVVTFTNKGYYTKTEDTFVTSENYGVLKTFLYKIIDNAGKAAINLVHKNIVLVTIITVLFLAYGIWYLRKNKGKNFKTGFICFALAGLAVSNILSAYIYSNHIYAVEGMARANINKYYILMTLSILPFFVFLSMNIILLIGDKNRKELMLFMLGSTLVFSFSTLFFKEFFAGAFFGERIYFIIACVLLIEDMAKEIKPTPLAKKTIILASGAYLLVALVILFSAYKGVNETEKERAYYRALQDQIGQQTIYIKTADDERLYLPNPDSKEETYWYKLYYDLDVGANLIVLDDEEYEKFKSEFDYAVKEGNIVLRS